MTTIATCWAITRKDATVYAFTAHDQDLTVSAVDYKSAVGYVPSAIDRTDDLQANDQQLIGIIDNVDITSADLRSGLFDGARVEIFEVDWTNPAGGSLRTLLVGFLGKVDIVGRRYQAELRSLESELEKPYGRTIKLRCDADLGDTRCGYTLTSDSLTVTTVNSQISIIDTGLSQVDDYYNAGKLVWLTGNNAGLTSDVKRYTSSTDTVEIYQPLPATIQVGDTGNIFRGCDKTLATCRDTFSNVESFRGFPYLPGVTDLIAGTVQ